MNHKLGIIVPYRNRYRQLIYFKKTIKAYLEDKGIDYDIIIVEQDDATAFNRGKLLNIGALRAKELGCDYIIFHDVDMLPVDVDYSYSPEPVHLATNFITGDSQVGVHFDQYFGGVTLFPLEVFEKINGFSNEYWGWGFEDDDLFFRVLQANYEVDTLKVPNFVSSTASLMFNGIDSFVKVPNSINYRKDFSIYLSFKPGNLELNHEKDVDRFTIFSVPGYDFSIYYDSFKRYNIEIFDKRGNIHSIVSNISEKKPSKIVVTWNAENRIFCAYLDGKLLKRLHIESGIYNYGKYRNLFLGCSNRNEDAHHELNYFKGGIDSFGVYECTLTTAEVEELVENNSYGLTTAFGNYRSNGELITYYDAKLIRAYKLEDLSGYGNTGIINKCWVEPTDFDTYKEVAVPKRRKSTFKINEHKPGGYLHGRWRDQLTRYNQLKFINEVAPGYKRTIDDGLNNISYKIHGETAQENVYQLNVGL